MEIRKYIALIYQWAWLILLAPLVAGGIAYIVNSNTQKLYASSVRLLIDEAPGGSNNEYADLLTSERKAKTYVELITVNPVLSETINRLELDTLRPEHLRGSIQVSAPIDTQIIDVSVTNPDPERAQAIANTLAEVFIEHINNQQESRYAGSLANFEQERNETGDLIEEIETEINQLTAQSSLTPAEEANLSRLETQLKEAQLVYNKLFDDVQELRIQAATQNNNILIAEQAEVNSTPISPQTRTNTLLAAIVGLLAAVGIIFLIDYFDDTIKSPDQVMEKTGLSSVGIISYIKGETAADRLITHAAPRAPTSEAFRVLRTNLNFSMVDTKLDSVLITSGSPGEGKSTTTANLAAVMAQAGNRVIIVDADLRRPSQHKIFEIPNNQGLTTALLDSETPVNQHVQKTEVPGLRIMTSGPLPPNPAELLNSQRMQQVMEDLKQDADVILVDTPPALTVADASILAPKVNGALIVAEIGATREEALFQANEALQKTGAHVFGIVLNRSKAGRVGYYQYYYHNQNYEYGYSSMPGKRQRRLAGWLGGFLQ